MKKTKPHGSQPGTQHESKSVPKQVKRQEIEKGRRLVGEKGHVPITRGGIDANTTVLENVAGVSGSAVARPLSNHRTSDRSCFTNFLERLGLKALNSFQDTQLSDNALFTRVGKGFNNRQRSQIDYLLVGKVDCGKAWADCIP